MPKITFDNKSSPFFKALKEKVEIYFKENKSEPSGGLRIFWVPKLTSTGVYIVCLIFMVDFSEGLIGLTAISFICVLLSRVILRFAHAVKRIAFFEAPSEKSNEIKKEVAIHQNNATESKITNWLLGGLNFQIEHHLFSGISHIHYPKINQFVKETCVRFNVTYNEYPSVFKAFLSHFSYIKKIGAA